MCKNIETGLQIFITTIVCVVVWAVLGFVGFVMDAKKYSYYDGFNKKAKSNLCVMVGLGAITFFTIVCLYIADWFNNCMDILIKKLNK